MVVSVPTPMDVRLVLMVGGIGVLLEMYALMDRCGDEEE